VAVVDTVLFTENIAHGELGSPLADIIANVQLDERVTRNGGNAEPAIDLIGFFPADLDEEKLNRVQLRLFVLGSAWEHIPREHSHEAQGKP